MDAPQKSQVQTDSMNNPQPALSVCFLWHMHQPVYKNPQDGTYLLPWTRLHAVKDYLDMALLIEAVPGMKAVFNMVPSLLVQLQEYAEGAAEDRFLRCSRMQADKLSDKDRSFLLHHFFMANRQRKIGPSPRYTELLRKRGEDSSQFSGTAGQFTIQDYLDLQVHFNLAWCGPSLRKDGEIIQLIKKDSGYTEEEKEVLLSKQDHVLRQILPVMRRLLQNGQIEVSFSPFYHPILPLLCDTEEARRARPETHLPENRFQFPEDAEEQIRLARKFHENVWGRPAEGMWPSEGAVSDRSLDLAIRQGVKWVATDQAILQKSLALQGTAPPFLSAEDLYSAYEYENPEGRLFLFFRNQILSDLIGFTYSSWDERQAAEDFFSRLLEEKSRLADKNNQYLLSIIMDGENAWEYFPEGGQVFLKTLYQMIVESDQIRPLRFCDYLGGQEKISRRALPSLAPGTWIHADFSTWIGERIKNKAWDHLFQARQTLQKWMEGLGSEEKRSKREIIEEALQAIYTAEGSDWFWWMHAGGERPSQERIFDDLMNLHLIRMYKTIGIPPPSQLKTSQGVRD